MDIDRPELIRDDFFGANAEWTGDVSNMADPSQTNEAYTTNYEDFLIMPVAGPSSGPSHVVVRPPATTRFTIPDSPPSWETEHRYRPATPHPRAMSSIPSPLRLPPSLYPGSKYTTAQGDGIAPAGMLFRPQTGNVYTATAATRAQVEKQRRDRAMAMFTPPPHPHGFSSPCLGDPEALYEGLPRHRKNNLMAQPADTVFLVRFYNVGHPKPNQVQALTESLATTVTVVTGEVDPVIVPPEADYALPANARGRPMAFAVMNLRPASVRQILARNAWSAPSASFFPYPREMMIGDYLFTIEGITRDYQNDIFNTVYSVFDGPNVRPLTIYLIQQNPDYVGRDASEVMEEVLASLRVRVDVMTGGAHLAAIYCMSPTRSIQRWRQWRDGISRLTFPTSYNLTGRARPRSLCGGCHAADHVTHLCPYPDIPGWNSPPAGGAFSYTTSSNPPRPRLRLARRSGPWRTGLDKAATTDRWEGVEDSAAGARGVEEQAAERRASLVVATPA